MGPQYGALRNVTTKKLQIVETLQMFQKNCDFVHE